MIEKGLLLLILSHLPHNNSIEVYAKLLKIFLRYPLVLA
jgi:hypothetical protein